MNNRFVSLLAAVALVALLLGVGALLATLFRPQTAIAQNNVPVRQITVVGHGEARGAPDTANVQIGVQTQGDTARAALTANNTQMQALIAKLKELGVADKDLQTSNVSISPRYDNDGRSVTGYQVSNMVSVTIRNIAQTGDLLDQVVDAGANSLYGVNFMIDDSKALEQTARDAAIAEARTRAEAMAKAGGGSIGQIISITENIGSTPIPMMARAADSAAGMPIQTGEQSINADVQVTFELR